MSLFAKLIPGRICTPLNPVIVDFGVNVSNAIIATMFALTCISITVYVKLSCPITVLGCAPVVKPALKLGPTNIQVDPVNIYNCWLSVSAHKSPISADEASGSVELFLSPLAETQTVPS